MDVARAERKYARTCALRAQERQNTNQEDGQTWENKMARTSRIWRQAEQTKVFHHASERKNDTVQPSAEQRQGNAEDNLFQPITRYRCRGQTGSHVSYHCMIKTKGCFWAKPNCAHPGERNQYLHPETTCERCSRMGHAASRCQATRSSLHPTNINLRTSEKNRSREEHVQTRTRE